MASGPTERTLQQLRKDGWLADVVERWIPHAKRRKDLFGIIDIVALGDGETLGVQCTSDSNMSARVHKLEESDAISALRECNWRLEVWGWKKKNGRWQVRKVEVS